MPNIWLKEKYRVNSLTFTAEVKRKIKKNALLNAINHNGKAQQGPVIGRVLAEMPHLRTRVKEIAPLVAKIVANVNTLNTGKIPAQQPANTSQRLGVVNWQVWRYLDRMRVLDEEGLPRRYE